MYFYTMNQVETQAITGIAAALKISQDKAEVIAREIILGRDYPNGWYL